MNYLNFTIIYLLNWLLIIFLVIKKIKYTKELYLSLTGNSNITKEENNLTIEEKVKNFLLHVLLQVRINNFRTKLMHSSIFLFALLFLISPAFLVFPQIIQMILDTALILGFIGIVLAIVRRYILKVPRIIISSTKDRYLKFHILLLLNIITFIFFFYFSFPSNTPLLFSIENYFKIPKNLFFELSSGLIFTFTTYLLMSKINEGKLFHTILAPINIMKTRDKDFSFDNINFEEVESFGYDSVNKLSYKDFIEVLSCTECGRCQESCPAFYTNQPLSPKSILVKLIDNIEDYKNNRDGKEIVNFYISEESIWSCTTCGACYNSCPVLINPLSKIINIRRNLVMEKGNLPLQLQEVLNSIEVRNHPFKGVTSERLDWIKEAEVEIIEESSQEVDYIYWVGCATSYDQRAQKIAIQLSKILKNANIKIGVLKEESCTGDPAKRIGNEYLFQLLAEKNIETLKKYNKKIITSCPHCYNTIKNEYKKFNFSVEIYHHSQILSKLIKEGKIKTKKNVMNLTFHDPCYLSRHNNIIEEPRQVISSSLKLTEMERSKKNSFCCGAGGGMYFLEKKEYPKINHERLDQAIKVSDNIATACPYCLLMLQDAANTKGLKNVTIKDITEWIETS
jgi:Fe-S oxidoreductase